MLPVPTLPAEQLINGLNHLPGPSAEAFNAEFAGILPEGESIPSSWGSTRLYDFSRVPTAKPQRRVILIHGAGTPAIGLAPLAYSLTAAGDNHVVIYDLWGHGCSSTPLAAHTPALYHMQLLELLAHLGWTTAHLVGYSLGGVIGTSFTALHRDMVESLTIAAAPGLWKKADRSFFRGFVEDGGWGREWLSRPRILSLVGADQLPREGWRQRWRDKNEMDTAAVEDWQRKTHPGHVASLVSSFRHAAIYDGHPFFQCVAQSRVKTLALYGELDGLVIAEETEIALRTLGWEGDFVVLEGAGHAVVRQKVPEVTELLRKFWDGLGVGNQCTC